VIADVKRKRGLPIDFSVSTALIQKQVNRKGLLVSNLKCSCQVSPLLNIKPQIVEVLIQMSRILESLTPSRAIALINDMITGTSCQDKISRWKKIHTSTTDPNALKEIGYKYWLKFKKRNSDKVITTKGQKYELDRSNSATYQNFAQMYSTFGDQMEEANIVERLDEPVWMNEDGVECEEGETFGCKAIHRITCPDLALCVDEVGADTSQKGDGAIGEVKSACSTGTTPGEKVSTKAKHWTLLEVTAFDGSHVICVVIFAGKQKVPHYETGRIHSLTSKVLPPKRISLITIQALGSSTPEGQSAHTRERRCLARATRPPRAASVQLS